MKRYLLDTSLLAAYLHNRAKAIRLMLRSSLGLKKRNGLIEPCQLALSFTFTLAPMRNAALMTPWVKHDEVATSILVYGEVIEYLKGLPNFADKYAKLHRILEEIPQYSLTYPILERYADIRRTLRPLHKDIGDIDTLIAATALEEHLTLVTIDHDFDRVSHLKVQLVNLKAA